MYILSNLSSIHSHSIERPLCLHQNFHKETAKLYTIRAARRRRPPHNDRYFLVAIFISSAITNGRAKCADFAFSPFYRQTHRHGQSGGGRFDSIYTKQNSLLYEHQPSTLQVGIGQPKPQLNAIIVIVVGYARLVQFVLNSLSDYLREHHQYGIEDRTIGTL